MPIVGEQGELQRSFLVEALARLGSGMNQPEPRCLLPQGILTVEESEFFRPSCIGNDRKQERLPVVQLVKRLHDTFLIQAPKIRYPVAPFNSRHDWITDRLPTAPATTVDAYRAW